MTSSKAKTRPRAAGSTFASFTPRLLRSSFCVQRELLGQLEYLMANAIQSFIVRALFKRFGDPAADLFHFGLFHPAGSHSRSADADAAGLKGGISIEGNCVLVHRDSGFPQSRFGFAAQHAFGEDIDEHEMGVSPAGDDAVTSVFQGLRQDFRIRDDLP